MMRVDPPRPRERLADRPRLILDVAEKIVGQRGYFGFSIKEVAERSGLSVPGVLHHFPTKEQLLIALLKERDRRDERSVRALLPADLTDVQTYTRDQMKAIFRGIVERNSKQPDIVRLYSMLRTEALYPEHPAHEFFNNRDTRVIEIFANFVRPHVLQPVATARRLLAMMGGLEELWLRDPGAVDLVEEWDAAMELLLPPASSS